MPKNEVSIFDAGSVPAHITDFNQSESNIVGKNNTNRLSIKGKVFTVIIEGNKQVLMKKNDEGDEEPRQFIPAVILGYAARRGRAYYPDGFTDANPKPPTCWSKDGITPDNEVEQKQSAKCADCAMAKKGSKITDGGLETKACGEHRFVAIQLYRKWDMPAIQMRLSITSDYDTRNKEQEGKGWYAFSQYMDMLRARGVKHTASVVTRIKFDPASTHVKLMFSAVGWLSAEELEIVSPLSKSDDVQALINPVFTVGTGESTAALPQEDEEEDEPELTPAKTAKPKPGVAAKTPAAPAKTTKPTTSTTKPKVAPEPQEEPEEEDTEEAEEEVSEGDVVDEGGETAKDVTGIVDDAEADEDDEEAIAEAALAKAKAAKAKAADKKAADAKVAEKAAKARKQAAEEPEEEDDAPIKVAPAKAPKTAAVAAPAGGKVTAGKTGAAPKGTPAGKAAPVSKEVGAIIDEW